MWQAVKHWLFGRNSHRVARKAVYAFKGPRGQFQHFNKRLRLPSPAGAAFGVHADRQHVLLQLQSIVSIKATSADLLTAFKQKYGYAPRVGVSLVPGGGHGVFMEGNAAAGSMLAVYPGLVIRDMRTVDELTYGVVSSPPAVHYIASMPDAHASTIRCLCLWLWLCLCLWLWLWRRRRQNGGGHRRARCDGAVAVLHCLTSPASGCHLSLHAAIVRVEAQKSKNALIMKYVLAQRQPLLPPITKVLKFSACACGRPAPALQPQRTPRGAT
jgi:hypothetical protein